MHPCTCSESLLHPHTLCTAHYQHNVVVVIVFVKLFRESNVGHLTLGGGGVPVDQVGVGWVCTIFNGAVVPWLKEYALHNCIGWITGININIKGVNICATSGKKYNTMTW